VLLVVAYSRAARRDLRNCCRSHGECVVQRFGRVALLESTEFAAFQALRLHEKHGLDVQLERAEPFEPRDAPERVRAAARAYERRDEPATPYARFAAGRDLPAPEAMADTEL